MLHGELTIKGTTRPVSVDFEHTGTATDVYGNLRAGFEGRTTINRKDFGVTWNAPLEAGGVMVGEKIVLEFDVSAIKSWQAVRPRAGLPVREPGPRLVTVRPAGLRGRRPR